MVESSGPTPPSVDRCPDCGGALADFRCRDCGLAVVGPLAAELWSVEVDLNRLAGERVRLIGALRAGDPAAAPAPAPQPSTPHPPPLQWMPAPPPPLQWAQPAAATNPASAWAPGPLFQRSEFPGESGDPGSPPMQIQNVLLALGAFSLIVAAVVFLAVTWRELSSPGKALTLAGITTVFAVVTTLLRRRSLTATAEALAAVTVMLGLADAYAVRVGLFSGSDTLLVWAAAFAVLALADAAFGVASGTRLPRLASAVMAQLFLPVLVFGLWSSPSVLFAVLLAQSLIVSAALYRPPVKPDRLVAAALRLGGFTAWFVAAGGATVLALTGEPGRPVAAALLAGTALVAVAMAWWIPEEDGARIPGAAVANMALLAAATTLASEWLTGEHLALLTVGLAAAAIVVVARLERPWTSGPLVVSVLAALGVSAPSWPALVSALTAPWSELALPGAWAFAADRSVRTVGFGDDLFGVGPGTALAFLALLAVGALGLRVRPALRGTAEAFLALLAGVAACVVPFAVDTTVWAAAVLLLAMATFVAAVALWQVDQGRADQGLTRWWVLSVGVGVQGLAWSLLTPGTTLGGLLMVAVVAGGMATFGIQRSDQRVTYWGTLVASVASAASVPVAARVLDIRPEIGWTALAVVAAAVTALGCVGRERLRANAQRTAANVAAGVAGVAYGTALFGAVSLLEQGDGSAGSVAAILGAGALSALSLAVFSLGRDDSVPAFWAGLTTVLAVAAVAMVAVEAALSPSTVWLVVLAATAVAALVAMVGEAVSVRRDVVDAVDSGAAVCGTFGLAGLVSVGSADTVSSGLLLVALTLAVVATRPSRRPAAWMAALVTLVLVWLRLAMADISTVEAFTLPAAAFLAAVGVWRHRVGSDVSSWNSWAPGLLIGLGPSVLLSLGDPGLVRPVATVVAATAVTLIGSYLRRQAPLTIGAVALVALGAEQLGPVVRQLPRWITFATVGTILLLVGASYERRRSQLETLRSHYRSLH